jgi:nitroreductase
MNDETIQEVAPILADQADYLIATAARAPSVHNTQPWRFRVGRSAIGLYCDQRRKLRVDPIGREMLISCGAALFGLRLAVRSLGYLPVVELLPDPARMRLLALVTLGAAEPMTVMEREMLKAVPHRHTHRGAFAARPLPAGLLPELQHDALAEGAKLDLVDRGIAYQRLADIISTAGHRLDLDPRARAEVRRWSRSVASPARDGIPAHAFPATADWRSGRRPGRLRQRDFDLGRSLGLLSTDSSVPAVTAVLLTPGDSRADWLRAGQALYRLLLHAASQWVFASLYTQPLEAAPIRALIRDRLSLPGAPQMLLQLGVAHTTHATARRPPDELIEPLHCPGWADSASCHSCFSLKGSLRPGVRPRPQPGCLGSGIRVFQGVGQASKQ